MRVFLSSVEVGLEDCADGSGPGFVEAFGDGDGGLGVVGAFHIDADEAVDGGGVLDHFADDALGQIGAGAVAADVHAHLGELYADVGVELAGGDLIEEAVVDGGALLGLGDLEDALTEGVERDGDSFGVEVLGGLDGCFYCHAGDEAAGDPSADGRAFCEGSESPVGGKRDKKCP